MIIVVFHCLDPGHIITSDTHKDRDDELFLVRNVIRKQPLIIYCDGTCRKRAEGDIATTLTVASCYAKRNLATGKDSITGERGKDQMMEVKIGLLVFILMVKWKCRHKNTLFNA